MKPGGRCIVDARHKAIVVDAWPQGSTSYAFPHYRVRIVEVGPQPGLRVAGRIEREDSTKFVEVTVVAWDRVQEAT